MTRRAGVVTGFVKKVDARQGRVQVEYRGIEPDLLSPWAYIAAPMSGSKRGALFMPEENDEVLVAYADGDFGHPYVVGFLWNGEHVSPETEPEQRVIVTPGGHQLRFEDKAGAKRVVLKSEGRRSLTLDDSGSGKVEIVSGSNSVLLDDTPAGTKVVLKAGKAVGVTITMNATPQPSLSIAVGAGNTIDVAASGVTVNASGTVNVTAGGAATVSIGGAANVTVGGAANFSVGGAINITAGAALNLNCAVFNVNAGVTNVNGLLRTPALIAQAVVGNVYAPGVGNLL